MSLAAKRRGFAKTDLFAVGFGLAIVVSLLALCGKAPAMFQYAPHFIYGCALYLVAARGSRVACVIAGLSLIGVLAQFFSTPTHDVATGVDRAVGAEFSMLVALLTLMTALAFSRFPRFAAMDRRLGDFTYPLYMSHPNAMIVILSTTAGYSYLGLVAGLGLAIALTVALQAVLDPAVGRLRDAIRGGALRDVAQPTAGSPNSAERFAIGPVDPAR